MRPRKLIRSLLPGVRRLALQPADAYSTNVIFLLSREDKNEPGIQPKSD